MDIQAVAAAVDLIQITEAEVVIEEAVVVAAAEADIVIIMEEVIMDQHKT